MRVFVAGTGAPGGIGRFERLLTEAVSELTPDQVQEARFLWRTPHPEYLSTRSSEASEGTLSQPEFVRRFYGTVRHFRPDVVICTHVNLLQAAMALPLVRPRPSVMACVYGTEVWERLPALKRRALRRADEVAAISAFTAERAREAQELPAQPIVNHLALEPSWFEADVVARSRDEPETPTVLSVARLSRIARHKNVDQVIRALPEVAARVPDVRHVIVGDGEDVPRLRRLAEEAGVADRVRFAGALSHDELLTEYAGCSVFALPSSSEGFGLVFLEAMAFAKPVVSMRRTAIPEVVEDGVTGVLLDRESELPGRLIELLEDPTRGRRLGAAGYERLSERFSFGAYADRLGEQLERLNTKPATVAG